VIYELAHLTHYRYAGPVVVNACALRLYPRKDGGQRVLATRIEVAPHPERWDERDDPYGNRVARIRIETPHRELSIKSISRVAVERPAPPIGALTPPWETIASLTAETGALGADSPAFAIYPSRMVTLFAGATDYARESFTPRRPIYEAASELNARIHRDFVYDSKATEVTTTPSESFARKRGVCQDFAHVMIAGLRGLGLPAYYISGYIRTIPPPGQARLQGADASHAWAAVWCGPAFGWLGLDPTNAIPEGDDHVVVARGRDYADVPPVEGVVLSYGGHELDVEVDVIPVEARP
jgi:transglutaminase-like putative cysteine protease